MLHPSHLEALLPSLSGPVLSRLLCCARLADRMTDLVIGAMATTTVDGPTELEQMALLTSAAIGDIGRMMGAVWYARVIARCIDAEAIAVLEAQIGRSTRLFGLRAASLAIAPASPVPPDALAAAILADGHACLITWRDALAEPYRRLATLKLPFHDPAAAAPAEQADPIIAFVARKVVAAREALGGSDA